ncbi:primosomal protein N' [Nonomuraea sp. NPDC048826]|uniref:primosomal protein N' n=1 Tax=Nonomuraea sp. NPDC048826 TaxID=3364347 RepID=UPI003717D95D
MTDSDDALLPLDAVRPAASSKDAKGAVVPAAELPVARVAVDNPLPHLDRPFDYLVPATMHDTARPGVRVRVRFAGKLVDGFLLERAGQSDHAGKLTPLERVVSPEQVLTPEIAGLARAVADRYAGTLADVLRLAIPPRHARTEAATRPASEVAGAAVHADAPVREDLSPAGPEAVREDLVSVRGDLPSEGSGSVRGDLSPEGSASVQEGVRPEGPAAGREELRPEAPASVRAEHHPAETSAPGGSADVSDVGSWGDYPMGPSFVDALRHGRAPRAVWTALPGGGGWATGFAEAARATLEGGRGALAVVPDGKDVALLDAELSRALGPGRHVALTSDLGPAERYRRWLSVLRGQVRAVVGTRAAMFAPVHGLGLVALWDDGDDLHAERLAPYPHAREVLGLRAHRTGAAMLIGGYARTAEATQLIATRWARPIVAARQEIRRRAPRVRAAGEDAELARDQAARAARLPSVAWRVLRQGLADGPVLVQVPRRGYLPALACAQCRAPARCAHPPTRMSAREQAYPVRIAGAGELPYEESAYGPHHSGGAPEGAGRPEGGSKAEEHCHGPLALRTGHAAPYCRWCGRVDAAWKCPACGNHRLRAVVVGARRTAEELGRAFPSVPVRTSGRDGVLARLPAGPALVVATPGAEPVVEGGYAAAVLLDGWALLGRADLRAGEEAVRRWLNAAALLRPGGGLVVLADAALPAVQALVRWDPVTYAERELADRAELGFPPAVRMATLTGASSAVRQMLEESRLPGGAQVLGPVPVDDAGQERALVRVPRAGGAALAAALKGASGVRAARKAPDVVKVCVDPLDLI